MASDYVMTSAAWLLFNLVRYSTLEELTYADSLGSYLCYTWVVWGQILVPLMMMGLYWLSGFYNKTFKKSRLETLGATAGSIMAGVVILYFAAIIDDPIPDRYSNYILLLIMGGLFLSLVLTSRLVIVWIINRRIARREIEERILIVGDSRYVAECFGRMLRAPVKNGLTPVAVMLLDGVHALPELPAEVDRISIDNIEEECRRLDIAAIVIALPRGETVRTMEIVRRLYSLELPLLLPAWSAGDLLANLKVSNVAGELLTDISSVDITESQRNVKRLVDVVLSSLSLMVLAPAIAVIGLLIKRDSNGPVFYSQERVGMHRRVFRIYKLRTMRVDAEVDGPALSSNDDSRVTRVGRVLRRYRLDETPQFWNVLKGDMSLVGPRPEREFFEEQIVKLAPHYVLVHQVRPGLTSWGMVKYGYAATVEQMVERLAYDMIYLKNVSQSVDFKIMFFTVRTVLTGKGV